MSLLPLSGLRVLDLAYGVAGPYAARLLGDLGAEVIKVESPSGDPARGLGPFPDHAPHPERSGMFVYLNRGKRGVVLDLQQPSDRDACVRLAASVDVVIESSRMRRTGPAGSGPEYTPWSASVAGAGISDSVWPDRAALRVARQRPDSIP